jgi:hypothetical protein
VIEISIATAALVFLRGLQQQNVIHGHYIAAALMPFLIAAAEVASVLWVVNAGWMAVPWVGAGGAVGVTCAMYLHRSVIRRPS